MKIGLKIDFFNLFSGSFFFRLFIHYFLRIITVKISVREDRYFFLHVKTSRYQGVIGVIIPLNQEIIFIFKEIIL